MSAAGPIRGQEPNASGTWPERPVPKAQERKT